MIGRLTVDWSCRDLQRGAANLALCGEQLSATGQLLGAHHLNVARSRLDSCGGCSRYNTYTTTT